MDYQNGLRMPVRMWCFGLLNLDRTPGSLVFFKLTKMYLDVPDFHMNVWLHLIFYEQV